MGFGAYSFIAHSLPINYRLRGHCTLHTMHVCEKSNLEPAQKSDFYREHYGRWDNPVPLSSCEQITFSGLTAIL